MVTWFLQINLASLHSIYVGVLLFFGSARHIYFNQAWTPLDQGWQAGRPHAAPSDRLTLVRHVLSSIHLHISLVYFLFQAKPTS